MCTAQLEGPKRSGGRGGEAVTISTQWATEGPEEMTVELRDTWLPDPGAIY